MMVLLILLNYLSEVDHNFSVIRIKGANRYLILIAGRFSEDDHKLLVPLTIYYIGIYIVVRD
jgi:hypothetical protein